MKKILVLAMALALVAALVVPMVALAAVDSTEVTGTVAVAIEVSAPDGADLGSMEVGDNVLASAITVTVNCTQTGWTLGAKDASNGGKMSGAPGNLTNALKIEGGDQSTYTALSGTDVLLETTGAAAAGETEIDDVNFQQTVEYADTAGSYAITITFTGTATP
jgi:hypothetical protein